MPPIPQSPTRMSLRHRDTGFPESFCGSRNTTLPHPEAVLGPDACITEDDVNPARALLRCRMSYMAQLQSDSRASTFGDGRSGGLSEEGTLSALGRLAINSLRTAELPRLDALLPSRDGDGVESSDGMSSSDPDSPVHRGREFGGHPKIDAREPVGNSRHKRRGSSFISRLMHR
ncbi:uncharacterized protein P884DRAFT_258752 [Thermothelomyces heterothallicus CBS 202.75]|uniref:uncharacterized protein n=1 Tax=Thermothelomyces heterothallicus CBS 202.75 TaxID=1149848 RepID=UPI003742AD9C